MEIYGVMVGSNEALLGIGLILVMAFVLLLAADNLSLESFQHEK